MTTFRQLEEADIELISGEFIKAGLQKEPSLFRMYLKEQTSGKRLVLLAFSEDSIAGYSTINWESDYPYFKQNNIPEIMDLNVLPQYRGKKIGYLLLQKCEQEIAKKSSIAGLGVGLYKDYGAAQKLYISCGYMPDRQGITYNYNEAKAGANVRIDDDLVLWLTKGLE